MAIVNKIDSNITGLAYAEEQSLGVLPATPVWRPLEPNGYSSFGGEITTVARNPINQSRQRKKGVVTDVNATGGWGTDLTQENFQDIVQGFMFADLRTKNELSVTAVDTGGGNDDYELASGGDDYVANDLLFAKGFSDSTANGLKVVTGTPTATSVPVTTAIPTLSGELGTISRVGFEFASGDADIDASGTLPAITTTTKDLTTLGLIPGEFVFIGGDNASNQFVNAVNNGFCRIRSIATNRIEFDKTAGVMVDETGTGLSIHLFFGRVCKNELGTLIKRRSYQLERQLGAPDDALPNEIQSQYVVGAVASELSVNIASAAKVEMDLTFQGTRPENRSGATGVKSGTRLALVESDAFNTSDNIPRIKLSKVIAGNAAPDALFAFAQDITLTINNNIDPNKAVGVLGAFDVSAGTFEVSGEMTTYFSNVDAIDAVINNEDVSLEIHLAKANQGITIDLPLISLGDGTPSVEQDQPITLPLSMDAATGAKIDTALDHTLLFIFWDYLPDLAG